MEQYDREEVNRQLRAVSEEVRAIVEDADRLRGLAARLTERVDSLERELGRPATAPVDEVPAAAEPVRPAAVADESAPEHRPAIEGARVIALNMALGGTPREETGRYLRENFELADPDALLDEVYARAED